MSKVIDGDSEISDERAKKNALACCGPWDVNNCLQVYQQWSAHYDLDFNDERYRAPRFSAEMIARLFPENRDALAIMDVAAGTGRVGKFLTQFGFREIHALDPSTHMLEILKNGGWYKKIFQDTVGHHETEIPGGTYDVTTMSGGFVEGHVPVTALDEMLRVTKPGGYVVVSMREEYLDLVPEYRKLEPHAATLERNGLWRLTHRETRPNYFFEKTGIVFAWEVL